MNKDGTNFLWDLPGALIDIKLYRSLFEDFYHYDVMCTYDKNKSSTKELTLNRLKTFIRLGYRQLEDNNDEDKKEQYDALIFIWAGHGGDGTFITSNNSTKEIADIKLQFGGSIADFFIDKPKIIIKAACRGSQDGKNVKVIRGSSKFCNVDGEFISIFATTKGKTVYDAKDDKSGSYFTETLYKLLKDSFWSTQEIGTITTELSNRIKNVLEA